MIAGSAVAIAFVLGIGTQEGVPRPCRLSAFQALSPDSLGLVRRLLSEDMDTGVLYAVEELGPEALDIAPAVLCASRGCCRRADPDRFSEDREWGSDGVGGAFVRALASIGPAALPALVRAMESIDDEGARMVFARLCDKFGPEAAPAVPTLIRLMEAGLDMKWGDRLIDPALGALVNIGPAAVDPMLEVTRRALLNPQEVDWRRLPDFLAYWADVGIQNPEAASLLIRALPQSVNLGIPSTLLLNIEALGHQGRFATGAVRLLEETRDKAKSADVRYAAERALKAIQADIGKGSRPKAPGRQSEFVLPND